MAKALKCDRCGKYYEENDIRLNIIESDCVYLLTGMEFTTYGQDGRCHRHDLCDDCINALMDFLHFSDPVEYDPNADD